MESPVREPSEPSALGTAAVGDASAGDASAGAVKVEVGPPPEPAKPSWPRLAGLAVVMVALFAIGHFTGLTEHATPENLRALVESLGVWGLFLFIVLFAVGEFMHIPGMVFVLAGLLAYGRVTGGLVGYVGALVSVSFSFFLVRRVGGQALAHVKRARIARILERLDRHPIPTIFLLRMILFLMPAVNYALAMTRVRFRDYFIGSALGLVIPMILYAYAFEWVLARFFE